MSQRGLSRREMLELGLAAGMAGAAPLVVLGDEPRMSRADRLRPRGELPRNIIFMVADGMSLGVPSLAEPFSQLVRQRGTEFFRLWQDAGTALGFFETHSLNSLVTDSAAASTAWGSGARVFNGAINVLPDGRKLTPLSTLARQSGRRVGLVTTTTITHATPAGFAAVQANRDDEHLIAPQYLDDVDVLMGGGDEFFNRKKRADEQDVYARFAEAGYAVWKRRDDVVGRARPERVLGVFNEEHLPFTLDQRNRPELAQRVPTPAEMTRTALEILAEAPRGFLLQVEGGRVDHAAHNNDAAALLWDQLAFDDALAVVREFAEQRGDTLVVITSDHGNANPGLNGMGAEYRDTNACFERIALATASFDVIKHDLKKQYKAGKFSSRSALEVLTAGTGLPITLDEARIICHTFDDEPAPTLNRQHQEFEGALGAILTNHNGIGWTGTSHTADLAPILAIGPGREEFRGVLRNTDACLRLAVMLGVEPRNPKMSPEEAKQFLSAAPVSKRVHWA